MAKSTIVVDFGEIKTCNESLGVGKDGEVVLCEWRGRRVAVKQCFNRDTGIGQAEACQLSRVQHKNIVELYAISIHDGSTYLLMEYMEGGSLNKFLYGPRKKEHKYIYALDWAHQIAQALAHIHGLYEKPIIHRDIKPDNILLSREYLTIKIGDFGNATCQNLQMTRESGTLLYRAPEVFRTADYTEKCDVYSFGITLWEMMAMQQPLAHLADKPFIVDLAVVDDGYRPSFGGQMKNCPQSIKELIISCWAAEPQKRPSMESVVRDLKEALSRGGL